MNLLNKLASLVRGSGREALTAVVDANAVRILAQEVYDYEQALLASKRELTQLVAEKLRLERELEAERQRIESREQQLAAALDAGREAEVATLAAWIADQEPELARLRGAATELAAEEERLTVELRRGSRELQSYQRELRLAQARQRGERIGSRIGNGLSQSGAVREELRQSLARLRQRRQERVDMDQAARALDESLSTDPLSALDKAERERQREQACAAVIARVRLKGAPVRPA